MKRTILLFAIITTVNANAQTQPKVTITAPLSFWQLVLKALDQLPRQESNDAYQFIVSEANRQLNPPVKADTTKLPVKKSNN